MAMKKFSFKNKGSVIRTVKEPVIKKRKWTFDRITYWLIIIFLLFTVIRFSYNAINIIQGNGQIVFEKFVVNFTDDIRLNQILTKEGQKITKGDTLFSYYIENQKSKHELTLQKAEKEAKVAKDLIAIEKEIALKRATLKGVQIQLKGLKKLYETQVKMVLLEVDSHNELQSLKQQQEVLKSKQVILSEEIYSLNQLKSEYAQLSRDLLIHYSPQEQIYHYVAKTNGISNSMNFSDNEVCYRQQDVLTIHDPKKVQIRAYFGQHYAQYVQEGTMVDIEFPDGTKSKGKIVHSYLSTYALPSEFQKKYEPTERTILLDIEPINQKEAVIWRKFYLMDAKLTIKRFF